ncbi:Phosphoethanolamine N-methyltransferase [Colletotrichum chlorophyti]|uniref:Phosphoethanolamine N-methyltransferase n=1 Tax=Colletotrichum chlorophyti TaxID=708187 RepID=A0A1Q8RBJ0_9PEZI|nr:Phosphoethanolamine N-methyltransferase [Colletotrichum chlorophyti]
MAEVSTNASANPPTDPPATPPTSAESPSAAPTEAPTTLADIEVDEGALTDDASTIDDRISSYTASLTSSAVDYPEEYGRRYHAFREGSYQYPNDEREMDRLDFNHALVLKTIGKPFLAPIEEDKVHHVLDIGTGTGIWAMEMGDQFPNAEVIGFDLSAIQPEWVPPNVKFEIDDAESDWIRETQFDFIFARYLAFSIADWPKLVRNIHANLNPGGWAEFQDYDLLFESDDGTLTEKHETQRWDKLACEIGDKIGRTGRPGPKLYDWVKEAGFKNIVYHHYKIPVGPWAKDKYYKDIGMLNLIQLLDGLEAFTLKPFCGVLGWTTEEAQVLLANVRSELKTGAFHAHMSFYVVYGQKVEEENEGNE